MRSVDGGVACLNGWMDGRMDGMIDLVRAEEVERLEVGDGCEILEV